MSDENLLEELARLKGMSVTALRMRRAVTDADMADLRAMAWSDRMVPSSPIPSAQSAKPVVRGSGWVDPVPLGPPQGVSHVDRLCDAQDAADRQERIARMSPADLKAEIKRTGGPLR